jgi:hypothetical protein
MNRPDAEFNLQGKVVTIEPVNDGIQLLAVSGADTAITFINADRP